MDKDVFQDGRIELKGNLVVISSKPNYRIVVDKTI